MERTSYEPASMRRGWDLGCEWGVCLTVELVEAEAGLVVVELEATVANDDDPSLFGALFDDGAGTEGGSSMLSGP